MLISPGSVRGENRPEQGQGPGHSKHGRFLCHEADIFLKRIFYSTSFFANFKRAPIS